MIFWNLLEVNDLPSFLYNRHKLYKKENLKKILDLEGKILKEFYVDKFYYVLDMLSYIYYKKGEYELSLFYSDKLSEFENYPPAMLYNILSLIKLGYYNEGKKRFDANYRSIYDYYISKELDLEDLILCSIFFYSTLDELEQYIGEMSKKLFNSNAFKLLIIQDSILKNNFSIDKILELNNLILDYKDELIKEHFYFLLALQVDNRYFLKCINSNYRSGYMFKKLTYKNEDLKLRDLYAMENIEELLSKKEINSYYFKDKNVEIISFNKIKGISFHIIKTALGVVLLDFGGDNLEKQDISLLKFMNDNGVDESQVLAVIITHAHFDHYGSIKELQNCHMPIYMTKDTFNIINLENKDMIMCLNNIKLLEFYKEININSVTIEFFKSGHILGAAGVTVKFLNNILVYTGDFSLGRDATKFGIDLGYIKKLNCIDYLIVESTHGEQSFSLKYEHWTKMLFGVVEHSVKSGVKVFIPCFAIGKMQEVIKALKKSEILKNVGLDGIGKEITYYYQNNSDLKQLISDKIYCIDSKDYDYNLESNDVIVCSPCSFSKNTTAYEYITRIMEKEKYTVITTSIIYNSPQYLKLKELSYFNLNLFDMSKSSHASYEELLYFLINCNFKNIITVHGNGIKCKSDNMEFKL